MFTFLFTWCHEHEGRPQESRGVGGGGGAAVHHVPPLPTLIRCCSSALRVWAMLPSAVVCEEICWCFFGNSKKVVWFHVIFEINCFAFGLSKSVLLFAGTCIRPSSTATSTTKQRRPLAKRFPVPLTAWLGFCLPPPIIIGAARGDAVPPPDAENQH